MSIKSFISNFHKLVIFLDRGFIFHHILGVFSITSFIFRREEHETILSSSINSVMNLAINSATFSSPS